MHCSLGSSSSSCPGSSSLDEEEEDDEEAIEVEVDEVEEEVIEVEGCSSSSAVARSASRTYLTNQEMRGKWKEMKEMT